MRSTPRASESTRRGVASPERLRLDPQAKAKKVRAALLKAGQSVLRGPRAGSRVDAAQIFVSYATDNKARAEALVHDLTGRGFIVDWNEEFSPGLPYRRQIQQAIAGAKATVVIWCRKAAKSSHVLAEAQQARKRGTLLATKEPGASLSQCVPMDFEDCHTINVLDVDRIVAELERRRIRPLAGD